VTTVYLIDAGLCIEEEQLYCGIVLKVRDAFNVEPVKEKIHSSKMAKFKDSSLIHRLKKVVNVIQNCSV